MFPFIPTLSILAILPFTYAAGVLHTFTNTVPTIYYDNLRCENGNPCGATWEPGWADSISTGITACESSTSTTPLGGYKSNQIVAIDGNLLSSEGGLAKYCGKKVYKPDGTEYISPGGDLFVWDKCAACAGGGRVDFSAPDQLAMTGMSATECGVGPATFKVEILDENVVPVGGHPADAPGGKDTYTGGGGAAGAVCAVGGGSGGSGGTLVPSASVPEAGKPSSGAIPSVSQELPSTSTKAAGSSSNTGLTPTTSAGNTAVQAVPAVPSATATSEAAGPVNSPATEATQQTTSRAEGSAPAPARTHRHGNGGGGGRGHWSRRARASRA